MSRSGSATMDAGGDVPNLPFGPRAGLPQLLGDELVGSPRLAVFELVKNAYDADAETVRVVLRNIDGPKASIVVKDDGDGMTPDVVRDIRLVPGHDYRMRKRANGKRTRGGRLPLGGKGLGRFAAHKPGNRIEVVTRADARPFRRFREHEHRTHRPTCLSGRGASPPPPRPSSRRLVPGAG